jgi:hypothetical protein
MKPSFMTKADFVSGLVFLLFGLGVVAESARMPTYTALGANPWTAPGIVPAMVGSVIALLGLVLLVRSARAGGWRLGTRSDEATDNPGGTGRFLLCLALTLGYAAGLVGRVPFWLATFLFVGLFVLLFEWRRGMPRVQALRTGIAALLLAVVISGVVTYVFQYVFLVRLP